MYCDSKWQTGDFINKDTNTILMRLNSPKDIIDEEIKPNMAIKFKTFSNMYAGVRYGTNGVLIPQYTDRGNLVEIAMPAGEDPNNLDTYIFGASEISELEDLSLLYANLINLSAASKLTKVIIGNSHPNYKNDVLKNISFSNNRLLKEVNICNCTGLTNIIDFSLCPDIQYIYATGSKISGVQLPDGGFVKILRLPNTVSNITLTNQHHIEEFMCEGYNNLTTIRIENSENIPIQDILLGCDSSVLASVSIKNINWNVDSEKNLRIIINKLIACKGSIVEGSVYLPSGTNVSDDLKVTIHQNFPNLNVIDDNPVFYIDYYNYDNTIWDTEMVKAGNDAVGPSKGDPDDIVQELQGLRHLFVQWKTLPTNVNRNYQIDATWQTQYAIKFYNGDNYLYSLWFNQGEAAKDPVASGEKPAPTKAGTNDMQYRFAQWDDLPTSVYKTVSVYAQYDTYWAAKFWNEKTLYLTEWVREGNSVVEPKYHFNDYTNPTKTSTAQYDYHFSGWGGDFDTAMTAARDFHAVYTSTLRKYNVYFYADAKDVGNEDKALYISKNIPYGSSTSYSGSTPVKPYVDNPDEYVFKGWMPLPDEIVSETNCIALFKFTGYLFGKLGKTADTATEYGWVDVPNWDKINNYWSVISSDVTAYKKGTLSEDAFFAKYPIGGRMLVPISLNSVSTKDIIIGEYPVADIEIIGHNHDILADGSGKAPLTFFCLDLPNIVRVMNETSTTIGGWKSCSMRTFLNEDLLNAVPTQLQSVIKQVNKISDGGCDSQVLVTTADKCWIPSFEEVGFSTSGQSVMPGQGTKYSDIFSNSSSRKKFIIDSTETGRWWLRSVYMSSTSLYWRVQLSGVSYQQDAAAATNVGSYMYVAFGFCI